MIHFVFTLFRLLRALVYSFKDPEFQVLLFLVVLTLLSGTLFYWHVEGWSLLDAFYFSSVTLTTVGYGDLAPSTAFGKIFTIIYLFVGLGLILSFVDLLAKRTLELRGERRRHPRAGEQESRGDARTSSRRSEYPPGTSCRRDP